MCRSLLVTALSAVLPLASVCADAQTANPNKPTPEQVRELMSGKRELKQKLTERVSVIAGKIGDLSKSGNLPTNDDSVALLRKYVDELTEVKDSLKKLDQDIAAIQAYIEGQKKTLPKLESDVKELQRFKLSGYTQFQFRDSSEQGRDAAAFEVRRARINLQATVDPKTFARVSFDLAGGTNRNTPITKDAFMQYELRPAAQSLGAFAVAGQFGLPLGYELTRSDADSEFPERAVYNSRLFAGERGRGVMLRYGLSDKTQAMAGLVNSLSTEDPEQSSVKPGPHGSLAGIAAIRHTNGPLEAGLSGLVGKRPQLSTGAGGPANTAPEVDRRFVYADVAYRGLFSKKITLRAEAMTGSDRLPVTTGSPTATGHNMFGWHAQVSYALNDRNGVHLRMEQMDPNTDKDGDAVTGFRFAYSYMINPRAKLTLSQEKFFDGLRNPDHYDVTTLRIQFRF
jgi:hypothetical protein